MKWAWVVLSFLLSASQILFAQENIYPLTHRLSELRDPQNRLTAQEIGGLKAGLTAAVNQWGQRVYGVADLPIHIAIEIVAETSSGRAGSRPNGWEFLFQNENDIQIFESCASYKLRNGKMAPHCPVTDMTISIPLDYLREFNFIDADLAHPGPIPSGKVDIVTMLAHEMGHGFGITGGLNIQTGEPPSISQLTIYDSLVENSTSENPVFVGKNVQKLLGGPMPVYKFQGDKALTVHLVHNKTSYQVIQQPQQNMYHYGRFTTSNGDSDETFFGLLAGSWVFKSEARIAVGEIDFALLKDLGIPVR